MVCWVMFAMWYVPTLAVVQYSIIGKIDASAFTRLGLSLPSASCHRSSFLNQFWGIWVEKKKKNWDWKSSYFGIIFVFCRYAPGNKGPLVKHVKRGGWRVVLQAVPPIKTERTRQRETRRSIDLQIYSIYLFPFLFECCKNHLIVD